VARNQGCRTRATACPRTHAFLASWLSYHSFAEIPRTLTLKIQNGTRTIAKRKDSQFTVTCRRLYHSRQLFGKCKFKFNSVQATTSCCHYKAAHRHAGRFANDTSSSSVPALFSHNVHRAHVRNENHFSLRQKLSLLPGAPCSVNPAVALPRPVIQGLNRWYVCLRCRHAGHSASDTSGPVAKSWFKYYASTLM
jgi:hypothetical protein